MKQKIIYSYVTEAQHQRGGRKTRYVTDPTYSPVGFYHTEPTKRKVAYEQPMEFVGGEPYPSCFSKAPRGDFHVEWGRADGSAEREAVTMLWLVGAL